MAIVGWSYTSTVVLISIIMFLIIAVFNRWLNDFGLPYNKWISWPVGILTFIFLAYIWALRPAFGIGIGAGLVSGIIGAFMFGETPVEE